MINEIMIVKDLLNGKNINTKTTYRNCFLLSKWFREYEGKDKLEIRMSIFDWAKTNHIYLNINLNDCIDNALSNSRRLTSDNKIRISGKDIQEINMRFDNKNVKRIALGLLCYAKQFADQDGVFSLPMVAFGEWVGISYTHISTRYINELIDYKFIERKSSARKSWNGKVLSGSPEFKILVPLYNDGEFELDGNDIKDLYTRVFK